jgi:hypothetical protein
MAVYRFRRRLIPKFKPGMKVRVKEESSSPYRGLVGIVEIIASEGWGLVHSIDFDSPGKLASYSSMNEDELEAA